MSLQTLARSLAALGGVMLLALLLLPVSACSSDPAPAAAGDFCSASQASTGKCKEPTDCDTQIGKDCGSLTKALSETTLAAAKDCLESGICGVSACVSRAQKGSVVGAAHKKLSENFCKFCAPSLADCEANFYKRGSKSPGLLVLPYGDEIVTAVDDECTGQDGCQAKFTKCASEVIARTVGDKLDAATADCVVRGFGKDEGEVPVGPDGKPQVVTCTPANCTGCCREDKCEKGDTSSACGVGAKACEMCSATSKCIAGNCKEPCGPSTCSGCCDGEMCIRNPANATCGEKGEKCFSCEKEFAGAGVCSNHKCIDGSCQATCTNGCCAGDVCKPGTAAAACGAGGEGCVDCGVGRTCSAATCQLDRTSLWDVYISFAVVPDKDKAGAAWDVLAGAPDPYLNVFTSEGTSVHSGATTVKTDSTVPFWQETPVKGVKASELLANTAIEIWDSDVDFDDYIGGCQLALTPAIFDGSLQTQICPASTSNVEVTVYYRINPHMN